MLMTPPCIVIYIYADEDTIINKLANIWECLIANKLSLNTTKTKYNGLSYQSKKCDLSQFSN